MVTKDSLPTDFTLSLALVDAIPVVLFSISMLLIAFKFNSLLFMAGAILVALAGTLKVLWKIIVACFQKNIYLFYIQLRYLMPAGFICILISCIIHRNEIHLINEITSFPSCIFYCLFIAGMCLMGVFAKKLDSSSVKSNWIEQITNGIAQLMLLIGILL